jgi:hypothetical protein
MTGTVAIHLHIPKVIILNSQLVLQTLSLHNFCPQKHARIYFRKARALGAVLVAYRSPDSVPGHVKTGHEIKSLPPSEGHPFVQFQKIRCRSEGNSREAIESVHLFHA